MIFADSGLPGVALGGSWVALGTSWGGLGPLLGALGPLLSDLGSFLWDLEAVLGRSWGLLVRSWELLARSWAVLESQDGQKDSGPGSLADQGREVLPPPGETPVSTPTPRVYTQPSRARRTSKEGLWNSRTGECRVSSGMMGRRYRQG